MPATSFMHKYDKEMEITYKDAHEFWEKNTIDIVWLTLSIFDNGRAIDY